MKEYNNLVKKYIHSSSRCELCSKTSNLTIHHIISRAKDGCNKRWNLAILCYKCHDEIELLDFDKISEYRFYIKVNGIKTKTKKHKIRTPPRPFVLLPSREKAAERMISFTKYPIAKHISKRLFGKHIRTSIMCPEYVREIAHCKKPKHCFGKCRTYVKTMAIKNSIRGRCRSYPANCPR